MSEELEPFVRHGTKENPVEVQADDILNAIAEGRDIDIQDTNILGRFDLYNHLDKDENGSALIKGDISLTMLNYRLNVYVTIMRF